MDLKQAIYKRKSVRKYKDQKLLDEQKTEILNFIDNAKRLYPDIKIKAEIVDRSSIKSIFSWLPPQLITIYSQEKDGFLENVGFTIQQLELFLNLKGLGCCWLGIGKPKDLKEKEREYQKKYVIMLAVGVPDGVSVREIKDFKRLNINAISSDSDPRLECARLAPSSVNSQPWYFENDKEMIHVFANRKGILRAVALTDFNIIDVGISLAHVYVEHKNTFSFFKEEGVTKKGMTYIGSIKI